MAPKRPHQEINFPGSSTDSAAVSATGSSSVSAAIPATGRRYFPECVTFAILLRLPVKSLLRFKIASKQWRAIVSLPQFISQHFLRSPELLLIHTVTAPRPPTCRALTRHFIARYEPPNPEPAIAHIRVHPGSDVTGPQYLEVIGTTPNGIVCIAQERQATTLTLWNPATRSPRPIPPPPLQHDPTRWNVTIGLAFNPDQEDFNVIRIACHTYIAHEPSVAEVFSVRTGQWRTVDQPVFWVYGRKSAPVINGVPYWPCEVPRPDLGGDQKRMSMLLSFDVNIGAFTVEPLEWASSKKDFFLGEIKKGRLGAVVWDKDSDDKENQLIDIWMRGEGGGWTSVCRDRLLPVVGTVRGFYGEMSGIVVEHLAEGNLSMLNLERLDYRDFQSFEGEGEVMECFRIVNYRESLYPIPEIGNGTLI